MPATQAKEFHPGDLELCGKQRCVTVLDPELTAALGEHIYTGPQPSPIGGPKLGVRLRRSR